MHEYPSPNLRKNNRISAISDGFHASEKCFVELSKGSAKGPMQLSMLGDDGTSVIYTVFNISSVRASHEDILKLGRSYDPNQNDKEAETRSLYKKMPVMDMYILTDDDFDEHSYSKENLHDNTLLLVYEEESGVFLGLDVKQNIPEYIGDNDPDDLGDFSRTLWIPKHLIGNALKYGFSFDRTDTNELVVGIRKDRLGSYFRYSKMIHDNANDSEFIDELVVQSTSLYMEYRPGLFEKKHPDYHSFVMDETKSSFKDRVRSVYNNRCAVTGMQLGLFEAAHIYPKMFPDTSFHVNNGILLQNTFHKAFDNGMIYLEKGKTGVYKFKENSREMINAIDSFGKDGLQFIRKHLNKPLVSLPDREEYRPSMVMMRKSYTHYKIRDMEHLYWTESDEIALRDSRPKT